MDDQRFRTEKDSMGTVKIPIDAYYGPNTQRAVDNFKISALTFQSEFIDAIVMIKKNAATVNATLDMLDQKIAQAISQAAQEILEGKYRNQFCVDVFQTGSGTSTNMNVNEVIATRANEILTGKKTAHAPVHPNDHVNLGQSSNDVIPSAIHIAACTSIQCHLLPGLNSLYKVLQAKTDEFQTIRKIGRTHVQDAVPMFLGDEFSGYARQIELGIARIEIGSRQLEELALGGTAVGNGLNTHPLFAARVIELIAHETGIAFREARNHFEAQATQDGVVFVSGILKTIAAGLVKIANDIRWLASGPRCGLGEITLPSLQPGSSIMPGKVNPVIPESVIQVAAQVMGNDTTITIAGRDGIFELNVMLPVMAYNLLQSIRLLSGACRALAEKCIQGITANSEKCAGYIEHSLAMATYLVPHIGYDKSAYIAKKAFETGRTVKEVAVEEGVDKTVFDSNL